MDDRELEARLGARLHRRFDGAEPPASLTRDVVARFESPPRRELPRFALAGLAAAAVLIVAVIAANAGLVVGPGGTKATPSAPVPSASESAITTRQYIVLPPVGSIPTKTESTAAFEVLNARLNSLGTQYPFSASEGYAMTFTIPVEFDSPSISAVLAATGDLAFVPLPPVDYTTVAAVVGAPLPKSEPTLFGWDGIASASVDSGGPNGPQLNIKLKPAAAQALATYSEASVGQTLAILIDGKVALLPVIQGPITDGTISIVGASGGPASDRQSFAVSAAIIASSVLPESWRQPRVPAVIGEAQARTLALAAAPGAINVTQAELTTLGSPTDAAGLIPAWAITVNGAFPSAVAGSEVLYLNAITGALIRMELPGP